MASLDLWLVSSMVLGLPYRVGSPWDGLPLFSIAIRIRQAGKHKMMHKHEMEPGSHGPQMNAPLLSYRFSLREAV